MNRYLLFSRGAMKMPGFNEKKDHKVSQVRCLALKLSILFLWIETELLSKIF